MPLIFPTNEAAVGGNLLGYTSTLSASSQLTGDILRASHLGQLPVTC